MEFFGDPYLRDGELLEAEHPVAAFAVEVGVHVVDGAEMVAVTYFVFRHAAAVFEGVKNVMGVKQGQHPQDARALQGVEDCFDFEQAHR